MIAWLKDLLRADAVAEAPAPARAAPDAARAPSPLSRGAHEPTMAKQLALVIDLNVCVGCHACVTSCKEWNTSG